MAIVINGTGTIAGVSATGITTAPTNATDATKLPLAGGAMTGLLSNTVNVARNANQIRSNATNLLIENTHASGAAGLRLKGGNGEASIIFGENNSTDKLYLIPRNDTGKQVVIDHVGKVGIGTNSPAYALHIDATSQGGRFMLENTANGNTGIFMKVSNSGSQVGNSTIRQENNGDISIYQGTSSEALRATFKQGGGICFNSDTAAANALDDYEEGTWTPVYTVTGGGSHSSVSAGNAGTYTKVGRVVTISIYSYIVQTSGTITGYNVSLPFAAGNYPSSGMGIEFGHTGHGQKLQVNHNASTMNITKYDGSSPMQNAYFHIGMTYVAA